MSCTTNGPVSMYKLHSFYDDCENIELPTCVYKMNSFYGNEGQVADTEISKELVELERRQELILERLAVLSQQVNVLTKNGLPLQSTSTPSQAVRAQAVPAAVCTGLQTGSGIPQDVVIYASADCPPLSVLVLSNLLSKQYKVLHKSHAHSSALNVPPKLSQVFTSADNSRPRSQHDVIITVIWKQVSHGPCLLVAPSRHSMIEGEANVGRYLARLLSPAYDDDINAAANIDAWLDQSYKLVNGNKKEKLAVLKAMNTCLGKEKWLSGGSLSLADVILWSLIQQSRDLGAPPSNVNNWVKNCNNHADFEPALKAL